MKAGKKLIALFISFSQQQTFNNFCFGVKLELEFVVVLELVLQENGVNLSGAKWHLFEQIRLVWLFKSGSHLLTIFYVENVQTALIYDCEFHLDTILPVKLPIFIKSCDINCNKSIKLIFHCKIKEAVLLPLPKLILSQLNFLKIFLGNFWNQMRQSNIKNLVHLNDGHILIQLINPGIFLTVVQFCWLMDVN